MKSKIFNLDQAKASIGEPIKKPIGALKRGRNDRNGNIATTTMFKTRLPGNVPVNGVFELGMPKRGLEVLVRHWEQTGKPVVYKGALEVNAAPCTGELCINFHENSESATLSYTVLDSAEAAA